MRGASTPRIAPLQKWSSVRRAVFRTSVIATPRRDAAAGELRVVGDELVEAVDDRDAALDRLEERGP